MLETYLNLSVQNGHQWTVKSEPVSPAWWYHVAWTWNRDEGLFLFINGDLVDKDTRPVPRGISMFVCFLKFSNNTVIQLSHLSGVFKC